MRIAAAVSITSVLFLGAPARAHAQAPPTATVSVPRLITVSGIYQPASGVPAPKSIAITLAVYADASGGAALFEETQDVSLDPSGRYTVQFGATQADGLPLSLFAAGQERWLGVQFAGPGETERARTRLTSVPYALRAADAETLGGQPASAYVLAPKAASDAATGTTKAATTANDIQAGTPNVLAKYIDSVTVGNSAVVETGGAVGIGTPTPLDFLHVRYTNTNGGLTGFAVQNLGNTATSYSGMLFYDQNGALGQFQGFNNVTHEYRINNIARNGASQFDGSINFMVGSTSRFLVTAPGNIGIGTTAPGALLDVSNALVPTSSIANINGTTYGTTTFGTEIAGRKARGTLAAPTAAQNGDLLAVIGGKGYGATTFSSLTSGMTVQTAENWTDTAQGTQVNFVTIPRGTTVPLTRVTIDPNGNVGIGTFGPTPGLEVSNANTGAAFGQMSATSFTAINPGGSLFVGRKARGTLVAPTAVQSGDNLVAFLAQGFGATTFSGGRGGMFVQAAENWTDAAQGTRVFFNTTATGTNTPSTKVTIDPAGDVGIGTTAPSSALEVSRTGNHSVITSTAYANGTNASSFFVAQTARGTAAAPSAVQAGDILGGFAASGFGTTSFNDVFAAVAGAAAENFTDTARGSALGFGTTPLGTKNVVISMALLPNGNLAIGTPVDANGIPTATDKLQVFGDVRVGTTGTNGCLMNFAGTGLAGTCVSDQRYKKGITPFGPALDRVAALQPVHFYWRADEFPEHHFGDSQAYGLIAQEVEQVLPELVVTHEDGYKAVDYSKLPLLTIQAVKELKAQNDALKTANDDLTRRVEELERLIRQIGSSSGSR